MERDRLFKLFSRCMDLIEQVPLAQKPKLLDMAEQLLLCANAQDAAVPQNAPTSSSTH
jgi:hypothetical protein